MKIENYEEAQKILLTSNHYSSLTKIKDEGYAILPKFFDEETKEIVEDIFFDSHSHYHTIFVIDAEAGEWGDMRGAVYKNPLYKHRGPSVEEIKTQFIETFYVDLEDKLYTSLKTTETTFEYRLDNKIFKATETMQVLDILELLKRIDKKFQKRKKEEEKPANELRYVIEEQIAKHLEKNDIMLKKDKYAFRCAIIRNRTEENGSFMYIDSESYETKNTYKPNDFKEIHKLLNDKKLKLRIYIFKKNKNVVLITDNDIEIDEKYCLVHFVDKKGESHYFDYYDNATYAYYPPPKEEREK